jgi:MFS family permease
VVTLAIMTIGAAGMYVVVVVLPEVEREFNLTRGAAAFPYAMTMIGFGLGGILMGRLGDKHGVAAPLRFAGACIGIGFIVAGLAPNFWVFVLAQGLLIGFLGCSATFSPLLTETSFWFSKRRGIAVAICASGNYLGGALWPPVAQHISKLYDWRTAYLSIGVFCILTIVPLAMWLHRGTPVSKALRLAAQPTANVSNQADTPRPLGLHPQLLLFLLSTAGVACCVAMSMPQVHIVAMCNDLGYGATRGAQMLSIMLAFGIVSRLISGLICDRIGGLRTLMLGSALQALALILYLPSSSMASLFLVSALFGLFQGGIVPSYAIIVRELFGPKQAGQFIGTVLMATMVGMALGGWLSGKIFDWTGSYQAAFFNGIAWNVLNLAIAAWLWRRKRQVSA